MCVGLARVFRRDEVKAMIPDDDICRVARRTSVRGVVIEAGDARDVRRQKMARIILDSMYQFLGLLDLDGTVLEINQAALNGAGVGLGSAGPSGKPAGGKCRKRCANGCGR